MDHTCFAMFIVGLLGAAHCASMCGGIVGALALQTPHGRGITVHLAYNAGRIASYALAGFLAGALGQLAGELMAWQRMLYLIASLMLTAMGLYLLGVTRTLAWIERAGQSLWQRIQPFTRRFLPVQGVAQAFPLGLLWGWLPCGLVYGALVNALAAGSALRGSSIMLAFGLGTLPNLLLAGLLLTRFRRFVQTRVVRQISGILVLGYGLYGLYNMALSR